MKITVLDDYQNAVKDLDCFKQLASHEVQILRESYQEPEALASLLHDTDILVLIRERTKINDELLIRLPRLRLISQTGKISNHLDLDSCTRHHIAVAEGIGSPIAPAELTWVLLMNVLRKIPQAIAGMKDGKWQINVGDSVHGKTIGIWGYGKIGKRIAQYASVFGAKVLVWGSESSRAQAVLDGHTAAPSKATFFQSADVVTLHLRLNEQTRGIVMEDDLRSLKDHAVLINTARAELIQTGALWRVLNSGKNINVGLDVYEEEPITGTDYPLLHMENVICTPHLGYVEANSYALYFDKAFDNVLNFTAGNPTNIANPEVLS